MSNDEKPLSDQLKQVVDDLDLEGKVKAAGAAAEDALFRGLGVAGQFVHERRDGIESFLDRAASGLDSQTGGRYADQVGHLRDQLSAGVASLAERRWTPVPDDASELEPPGARPGTRPDPGSGHGPDHRPDHRPDDPRPEGDAWSDAADDPSGPTD